MFHIIDDWYIMPDDYSWMVARKVGTRKIRGVEYPVFKDEVYYKRPEDALKAFCIVYARKSVNQRVEGTLLDLVNILSSDYEKLQVHIDNVLTEIYKEKQQ